MVGLTESDQEGLARRLVASSDQPGAVLGDPATGWRRLTAFVVSIPGVLDLLRFHLADVRPEVMSFGDGAHRCPGNTLALVETEPFLERLLGKDVRLVSTPRIEWGDIIAGYAVRGLRLQLA